MPSLAQSTTLSTNSTTQAKHSDSMANSVCPFSGQVSSIGGPIWLKNRATETEMRDTLYMKAAQSSLKCEDGHCSASIVTGQWTPRPSDAPRTAEEVLPMAESFYEEYFESLGRKGGAEHEARMREVRAELTSAEGDGCTYAMTYDEVTFGCRTAWRNSARCVARMFWNKLEVFDCRTTVSTAQQMADALVRHLEYALNGGNIRAAITLFPPRKPGREDFRLWNSQFFLYAGYERADGTVVGDPQNVPLTKVCRKLGWKGPPGGVEGPFDFLPLIVSAPGQPPLLFELPEHLRMEVQIKHPELDCISDMGLRWFALPAVADMRLDVGGLEFTAAPFNGWYTSPEIATRNFCDVHRYNLMEEVAKRMGLDTSSNGTMWKDKAMVHLNVAVLHSYQKAGVAIVDHHAAADAYMKFMASEHQTRGGCPSDWVWLVPPISGALTPLYHQQMILYKLRPSYEYQDKAWKDFPID